jgi:predicted dehydrogenase
MGQRLRMGIIGLGGRWRRRYAPALRSLGELFEVAAVCDQIPQQTAAEAARLRCPAAAGPSDLIERDDVGAVLLLDLGWQRLWPVECAARAGKPVFCLPALEDDAENADGLARKVREAGLPVQMATTPAFTPAALRLAEFQRELLGPVRLVVCDSASRRPQSPDSGLLAWLLSVLGAPPRAVTAAGNESAGLEALTLDAEGGRALQLMHRHGPGTRPALRVHVVAERGQATLEAPRRLSWTDADGTHTLTLPPGRPLAEVLLTHFYRVVTRGERPWPSLEDAHRALVCLRAAALSRAEGRRAVLHV